MLKNILEKKERRVGPLMNMKAYNVAYVLSMLRVAKIVDIFRLANASPSNYKASLFDIARYMVNEQSLVMG